MWLFEQLLNKPNYNSDFDHSRSLQLFGVCLVKVTKCKF